MLMKDRSFDIGKTCYGGFKAWNSVQDVELRESSAGGRLHGRKTPGAVTSAH